MRTDRGLDRLITSLDTVVAIAITLLVLPLVDVLPDEGRTLGLVDLLADEAGRFGTFVLSVAVIAQLRLALHRLVERAAPTTCPSRWSTWPGRSPSCCCPSPPRWRRSAVPTAWPSRSTSAP